MKLVKDVYADEGANAKTTAAIRALAKKLLKNAEESTKDAAARYVLLKMARDVAAQAPDGELTFQAIDAMAESFQVDALKMKATALGKFGPMARSVDQHKALSELAGPLADEAMRKDDFVLAEQLAKLGLAEARKARDREVVGQAQQRVHQVQRSAEVFESVGAALAVLEKSPADPDANLTVGKYFSFVKRNWEKGLPMLAQGSDPTLKALGVKESQPPAAAEKQAGLADQWWAVAESEQAGPNSKAMQARAGYWYTQALPGLSGLAKVKAEKRLAEAEPASVAEASANGLNLVPHVKVERHRVSGDWKATKTEIAVAASDLQHTCSRLMLPVTVEGGYDLSLEFTRLSGAQSINVILPVGASRCMLQLSGWTGASSGLDLVDGRTSNQNISTKKPGALTNGRWYALVAKVRPQGEMASIEILLDGASYIQWTGRQSSLALQPIWSVPEPKRPGLASFQDPAIFRAVKIRAVAGKVSLVRG